MFILNLYSPLEKASNEGKNDEKRMLLGAIGLEINWVEFDGVKIFLKLSNFP